MQQILAQLQKRKSLIWNRVILANVGAEKGPENKHASGFFRILLYILSNLNFWNLLW